jgi:hypothetical protein
MNNLKIIYFIIKTLILMILFMACESKSPSTSDVNQYAMTEIDLSLLDHSVEALLSDLTMFDIHMNHQSEDIGVDQSVFDLSTLIDQNIHLNDLSTLEVSDRDGVFKVYVTRDGQIEPDAHLVQGGSHHAWTLDEQGSTWVYIDSDVLGSITLFASHPQARTRSKTINIQQREAIIIDLKTFESPDQEGYPFSDPGEPNRRANTSQCGHCHLSINDQWFDSPHRRAAKNPIVYDLYTGRGSGHRDEASCLTAGGQWTLAPIEGQNEESRQCFFEISALATFNDSCESPPCRIVNSDQAYFGGCADCHAPAINGVSQGGQDLMQARGYAFNYGVSCDLCHHVTEVDMQAEAGVAGRLRLHRPRETASPTLGGGGFLPLSFGPSSDVSNPRMGISPRNHYRNGLICGGCHQHQHEATRHNLEIHPRRWPEGHLPNQSTYQEWKDGPLGDKVSCNECHMPPNSQVMNSSHLEIFVSADVGIQGGWPRTHGDVRQHTWIGPRQAESKILALAASLQVHADLVNGTQLSETLDLSVDTEDIWHVKVQVSNVGAGHALPTGEPMRHLILLVNMECQGQSIMALAGDAVHDIGGSWSQKTWEEVTTSSWSQAHVGDRLRVVRVMNQYYDYNGYGPFATAGRFNEEAKGLQKEHVIGEVEIISIDTNNLLQFNRDLPGRIGDRVYLIVDPTSRVDQQSYQIPVQYAGHSGFSFARVMSDQKGQTMVPHFIAYDIKRDNRLLPNQTWQTQHYFPSQCTDPMIHAQLLYRPYPWWLAQQRAWFMWDRVMTEVSVPALAVSNAP